MSDIMMNIVIIVLGAFFTGMLIYGFYIVLKPTPKSAAGKKGRNKPSLR